MNNEIKISKLGDLKIGDMFKYNPEDVGIFKILRKVDENWIESVRIQNGRISGNFPWTEVYPIVPKSEALDKSMKKKQITGKTPSEMLKFLTVYKDVLCLPTNSFNVLMNHLPPDNEFDFVIKAFKGQVLIGSIEKEDNNGN
ncbi:hypothetical protein ACR777_21990 [Sphingobacterium spiritivorum]|uniref:hypothetical protein n=1 Tax=Sphingobacterium spiritivorum TaxID=258 RepID=UPI003DA65B41